MDIEEFRRTLRERDRVVYTACDEWDSGIERCLEKEFKILTEDVPSTIRYLENDCTAEEFVWIGEVLPDVVRYTRSRDLLDSYRNLSQKYRDESGAFDIQKIIQSAEQQL